MSSIPQAVVTAVGDLLEKQLTKFQDRAEEDRLAATREGNWDWFIPEKESWKGDVFDMDGMSAMWLRKQHEEEFDSAVTGEGTTGDLIISPLQGDMLGCMERAFRSRHRSSVRNKIHAAARKMGHGHESGTIKLCMLNYLERMIKQSNT